MDIPDVLYEVSQALEKHKSRYFSLVSFEEDKDSAEIVIETTDGAVFILKAKRDED